MGHRIRILDREFTVVGVFAPKGTLGGESLDNQAFVPLSVAKRVLFGEEKVRGAHIQVTTAQAVPAAMDAIDELLLVRHRILSGRGEDFSAEDQTEIITAAQAATSTFETLTLALGAIALLVGGIGIKNTSSATTQPDVPLGCPPPWRCAPIDGQVGRPNAGTWSMLGSLH